MSRGSPLCARSSSAPSPRPGCVRRRSNEPWRCRAEVGRPSPPDGGCSGSGVCWRSLACSIRPGGFPGGGAAGHELTAGLRLADWIDPKPRFAAAPQAADGDSRNKIFDLSRSSRIVRNFRDCPPNLQNSARNFQDCPEFGILSPFFLVCPRISQIVPEFPELPPNFRSNGAVVVLIAECISRNSRSRLRRSSPARWRAGAPGPRRRAGAEAAQSGAGEACGRQPGAADRAPDRAGGPPARPARRAPEAGASRGPVPRPPTA